MMQPEKEETKAFFHPETPSSELILKARTLRFLNTGASQFALIGKGYRENKIKKGEMCRTFTSMGETRNAYILVGKLKSQRPFGRPRCLWKDNF